DSGNSESSKTDAVSSNPVTVSDEHGASKHSSEVSEVLTDSSPSTKEQTSSSDHAPLETESTKSVAVPSSPVATLGDHDIIHRRSVVSDHDSKDSTPVAEEQASSSGHAPLEAESTKTDVVPSSPVA